MGYKIFRENVQCKNIERNLSNVASHKNGFTNVSKKSSRRKQSVAFHSDFLKRNLWVKYYLTSFILLFSFFCLQDFFEAESTNKANIKNELLIKYAELALESNASKKNQAKNTQGLSLTLKSDKTDPIKIARDTSFLEKTPVVENKLLYPEQVSFDFNLENPLESIEEQKIDL